MTNADSNRLDRTEAILEQTVELVKSIGQRTDSNARAIEALSDELRTFQVEAIRDRSRLYQAMADLAQAQALMAQTHAQFQQNIYQRQSELDTRQGELSHRQGEIVEILKILSSTTRQQP